MTNSEQAHRNARMILEAATHRTSGYREWGLDLLHVDYRNGEACWSHHMDQEGTVILRGILAPRLLAELRERVETMDLGLAWSADPETVAAFFSEGVLRIIDELGGK